MLSAAFLGALKVLSESGTGCPERSIIDDRLRQTGVVLGDEAVRVRFSIEGEKRTAVIEVPGSTPRTIEHEGPDCTSLADATVALLSVLLDERPAPPPPPSVVKPEPPHFRFDAALLASSGIVADVAAGASVGFAWLPSTWSSVGVSIETWPEREHALGAGAITLNASTLALGGCVGPRSRIVYFHGCLLAHGGFYDLDAKDFPVIRPEQRALFGGEAAARTGIMIAKGFGVFLRGGFWIPLTRLDVTARGLDSGFTTTSVGSKIGIGIEFNR